MTRWRCEVNKPAVSFAQGMLGTSSSSSAISAQLVDIPLLQLLAIESSIAVVDACAGEYVCHACVGHTWPIFFG